MSAPLLPRFNLEKLHKSHAVAAGWYALSNAMPTPADRTDLARAKSVVKLEQRYHARLKELDGLGWGAATTAKLTAMLACPAAGTQRMRMKRMLPCQQWRLCPFCWVRHYTWELFNRADLVVFPREDIARHRPEAKFSVLVRELRSQVPGHTETAGCLHRLKHSLQRPRLPRNVAGGCIFATIEPPSEDGIPDWTVYRRELLLLPLGRKVPRKHVPRRWYLREFVFERPQPADLVLLVGRMTLYPASLLMGPVEHCLDYVQTMEDMHPQWGMAPERGLMRLFRTYGNLRNKRQLYEWRTLSQFAKPVDAGHPAYETMRDMGALPLI